MWYVHEYQLFVIQEIACTSHMMQLIVFAAFGVVD